MSVLDRWLLARALAALAVVWPALTALVVASQALRLGYRFVGAGAPAADLVAGVALALVPAALVTAAPAAAAAAFWALARPGAAAEREALAGAGAPPWRLAVAPCAAGVIAGLLAQALLAVTPAAARALEVRAGRWMAAAALARVRPGRIEAPAPGLAAVAPASGGIVVADERAGVALHARAARPAAGAGGAALALRGARLLAPGLPPAEIGRLHVSLATGRHLGFVARAAAPALPPLAPALAIGACAVALALPAGRRRAAGLAALAVACVLCARAGPAAAAALAAAAGTALVAAGRRGPGAR